MASATVSNTGRSRCLVPPLPGVTPPTIWVPYAIACSEWNVPCAPVKPWQMTLVFLSMRTAMLCGLLHGRNDLLGRVGEVARSHDLEAAFVQNLFAQIDVGAFEAHHQRH